MKKILHISCGGLGNGGISTVIFSIVESLYKEFEFDCVVFKRHCEREEKFLNYGKLYRINTYNDDGKRHIFEIITRPFRMYYHIYKLCRKNKYDVIHCHNNHDEWICLAAAKAAGVSIRIAHSHNTISNKESNSIIYKKTLQANRFFIKKFATDFIGCSKAACEDFFGKLDYKVICNSVDLEKYKIHSSKSHPNINFIHVGRYTYQKNQTFIIEIFKYIYKVLPNARLNLIGFGEDKEKLEKIIISNKLSNVVKLIPGNKGDITKYYDYADYMIFPSNYEGFGIVLIEAQAKGIPCFVSDVIQSEADAGLLTFISLSKSAKEWADIILDYIHNEPSINYEELNKKLGKYDKLVIAEQYKELYRG